MAGKKEIFRSYPGVDAKSIGPFASVFISDGGIDDGDSSDFRQVPKSDCGNAAYTDRGQRSSFATNRGDAFPDPVGLKRFAGYGADEADLVQGYVTPTMNEDPAYDLTNYKDRSTAPRRTDEDFENTQSLPNDYEFRARNRRSRGFLTRPHIPTER